MIGVPLYTRFGEERKIKSGFQIQTYNGTRLNFILFHKPVWLFVDIFLSTIMLFTSKPQDFKNRLKNELPLLINVSNFLSPWWKDVWFSCMGDLQWEGQQPWILVSSPGV